MTTKQLFVLILLSPSTEGVGESAMQRKREGGHARIAGGDPLGEEAMVGGGAMNSGEESFFLVGFSGLDMVGSQEAKKLTRESGSQTQRC